jgi:hypothetical protein
VLLSVKQRKEAQLHPAAAFDLTSSAQPLFSSSSSPPPSPAHSPPPPPTAAPASAPASPDASTPFIPLQTIVKRPTFDKTSETAARIGTDHLASAASSSTSSAAPVVYRFRPQRRLSMTDTGETLSSLDSATLVGAPSQTPPPSPPRSLPARSPTRSAQVWLQTPQTPPRYERSSTTPHCVKLLRSSCPPGGVCVRESVCM